MIRYGYGKEVLQVERRAKADETRIIDITPIIKERKMGQVNLYSKNYINPPIPEGYVHICGEWNHGFVIQKLLDGSQFVWVPVGSLEANGTLDGRTFVEKLGRRNYRNDLFSETEFHEPLTEDFMMQLQSVKKYGGFYISRYPISKNKENGRPQSVKGEKPWTNITVEDAKRVAEIWERSDIVTSHLTYGAEYDSVLEWFIKSKAKTRKDIMRDSTKWGMYWNSTKSPRKVIETGSLEVASVNNICDMAGNIEELTQEQNATSFCVIRGGSYCNKGNEYPVSIRLFDYSNSSRSTTGFRIVLSIK